MQGSATVKDTKGKYVFWDIDGTLAPFRFNNHISSPDGTDLAISMQEIEDGVFYDRMPSRHMQCVLASCMSKANIVMGHKLNDKERADKHRWLDKHFPDIAERLIVDCSQSKADCIIAYCKEHNIPLSEVVFVDDVVPFIFEAERKGIKSYHISSFLDWAILCFEEEFKVNLVYK